MRNEINAVANDIIESLSQEVATKTREVAILNSLVSQYKKKLEESSEVVE